MFDLPKVLSVAAIVLAGMGVITTDATAQSRLDIIKRDKKIVIGVRESTPPYGFTDKDGNVDWRNVAAAAGGLYGLYKSQQAQPKTGYQGGIPK